MNGRELLLELLDLARRQSAALAGDDLAEFERLADRRDALTRAMPVADWVGLDGERQIALDLLSCDRQNEVALREQVALVAQELAAVRQAARTLQGYRSLAETARPVSVLMDRSA